jgi:hypothetical protein
MSLATGFVPPCIPTRAPKPPAGQDWVHEIKHDGYRLQVRRAGDAVRLFTRRGYDWTDRYPATTAAILRLSRARSFTLDGEAVVTGADGVAVFDALHRRRKVTDAMLYAFDLLELNGEDMRGLPLRERKARLERLLSRSRTGIVFNEHTDQDGATVFRLQAGPRGHRLEAALRALPIGPVARLAQGEEPGQPGHDPGGKASGDDNTFSRPRSSGTYPLQAWQLDVLSLCLPPRQAVVALGDFEHFASRYGIKYFRGNSASIIGTIVPMRRIVRKLLGHRRTSLIGPLG